MIKLFWHNPMLEVPHIKEAERSRTEWLEQIYAVKRNIEKLTRRKIKRKELREAIGRIARAQHQARRLHDLRAADPPVVLGQHAMLALNAYAYDPVGVSEGSMTEMIRGIAARLIMPCPCPSFSPNEDRMYRLRQLVEKFRVDGVIYHVLKGCMNCSAIWA